jgi:hypothetical protein
MDQIKEYSPDFKMKKINNYDNMIKNSQRIIFDKFEMDKTMKVKNPKHLVSFITNTFINQYFSFIAI